LVEWNLGSEFIQENGECDQVAIQNFLTDLIAYLGVDANQVQPVQAAGCSLYTLVCDGNINKLIDFWTSGEAPSSARYPGFTDSQLVLVDWTADCGNYDPEPVLDSAGMALSYSMVLTMLFALLGGALLVV